MNREDKRAAQREERRLERTQATGAVSGGITSGADSAAGPVKQQRTSPAKFMREVRTELRKVAWPHRKELVSYTVVVLVVTTVLTLIIFGMDWVIRNAIINSFS